MADVTRQVKWLDLWCEMARCHVVITVGMREEAHYHGKNFIHSHWQKLNTVYRQHWRR